MKILELIPNLQVGGAEKFVVDLSNAFIKMGHDVYLVTLFDKCQDHAFEKLVDTRIHRVELGKKPGFDLKCLYNVFKICKKIKPDVVHAHTEAVKYLPVASSLCSNVKFFATIHSDAAHDSGRGLGFTIRNVQYKLRLVTPITISKASAESFAKVFGIETTTIVNGCTPYTTTSIIEDVEDLRQGVDFLFVHAASIQPVKNQLMLIKAIEELNNSGIKARLIFLGRPSYPDLYNELSKHWSNNIVYLGERANVRDYMAISDAFCLTSILEGMPITLIEAMSTGCVPIVTPAGGCVNMVESGITGFISQNVEVQSYLKELINFTSLSDQQRDTMRLNAKMCFDQHYNIEKTALTYINNF